MLQPPTRVYAANARRTSPSVARRSQFAGGVQLSRGAATAVTESAPASARTGALLVARSNSPRLVHVAGCGVATGVAVRSSDDALRSAAAVLICLLTKASIIAVQDCTKTKKHHNSGEGRMVPEVRLGVCGWPRFEIWISILLAKSLYKILGGGRTFDGLQDTVMTEP